MAVVPDGHSSLTSCNSRLRVSVHSCWRLQKQWLTYAERPAKHTFAERPAKHTFLCTPRELASNRKKPLDCDHLAARKCNRRDSLSRCLFKVGQVLLGGRAQSRVRFRRTHQRVYEGLLISTAKGNYRMALKYLGGCTLRT